MQFARRLKQLPLVLLMAKDLKVPRETQVLLVFQGEMVTLVFQDNQAPLALLAHLESVNLVLLVLRTFLPSMTLTMSSLV